jgi:hypothetical protein
VARNIVDFASSHEINYRRFAALALRVLRVALVSTIKSSAIGCSAVNFFLDLATVFLLELEVLPFGGRHSRQYRGCDG